MVGTILPLLVIAVIFYFIVIMPETKRRKKFETMLSALKKGDHVILHSGIYGTIQGMEDNVVHLRIADNVKIKIAKSAIAGLAEGESASS